MHNYLPKKEVSMYSESNYLAWLNSNEKLTFKEAWQSGAIPAF